MKMIFDASALLAYLHREPGWQVAERYLEHAVISAVNLSETLTILQRMQLPAEVLKQVTHEVIAEIIPFDNEQALIAAQLIKLTRPYGLSLGDRACLALAKHEQLPVLTADSVWQQLDLGISVHLLR